MSHQVKASTAVHKQSTTVDNEKQRKNLYVKSIGLIYMYKAGNVLNGSGRLLAQYGNFSGRIVRSVCKNGRFLSISFFIQLKCKLIKSDVVRNTLFQLKKPTITTKNTTPTHHHSWLI